MPKTLFRGGAPYGQDFLTQTYTDLRQLANDYEKATGHTAGARKLLNAADVIKTIREDNDDG